MNNLVTWSQKTLRDENSRGQTEFKREAGCVGSPAAKGSHGSRLLFSLRSGRYADSSVWVGIQVKNAMFEYGRHLGLAFQVVDDILDFTTPEELLGKPQVYILLVLRTNS